MHGADIRRILIKSRVEMYGSSDAFHNWLVVLLRRMSKKVFNFFK